METEGRSPWREMWKKKGVDFPAVGFSKAWRWVTMRSGAASGGAQRGGRILEGQSKIAPGGMSSAWYLWPLQEFNQWLQAQHESSREEGLKAPQGYTGGHLCHERVDSLLRPMGASSNIWPCISSWILSPATEWGLGVKNKTEVPTSQTRNWS